ncbi:MAG: aminoglycoside phosphotransferase family protein [Eubacteriales bacterium]|nr:aminoglycoside phosphotransferase family protein [Eubacteriales bacterium]
MMEDILRHFCLAGELRTAQSWGNGHINRTYRVVCAGGEYILQKINTQVFTDVEALMRNIHLVTTHLRARAADPREVLALVPTREGKAYYAAPDGGMWRVYDFVRGSKCLERADPVSFARSGQAFGRFQALLNDFPVEELRETIPNFHHTPKRLEALKAAARQDSMGRRKEVERELDFACAREDFTHTLLKAEQAGALRRRVTHNDTKLNNVLFDAKSDEALCVIDLDTVMPGFAVNDFGDSIRFGANTAAEDEPDAAKAGLDMALYEAYLRGFLRGCGDILPQSEQALLPVGAKMMTLECGMRFLTDYLQGDPYFATHRPGQNLDRCRTQFALVADMERKWEAMLAAGKR